VNCDFNLLNYVGSGCTRSYLCKVELLRIKQIVKNEDNRKILDNINLLIEPFSKTALIGETGSGKSTLMKIMAGLVQPSSGEAIFEQKRIEGPNEVLIPGHKKIGYLSQHFELLNNYRVEELLDMANKMEQDEADEIYQLCKIEHLLNRKTNAISGGERQRIALARVLVGKPKLLLLDEPFTNLDLSNNKIINGIINELCESRKTTVVLVSHDPANILSWADQIIVLQEGKMIQTGSPKDIYFNPVNTYTAGLLGDYNCIAKDSPLRTVLNLPMNKFYFRTEEFAIVKKDSNSTAANIKEKLFYGNHYKLKLNIAGVDLDIMVRNTSFSVGQEVGIEFNSPPI
jgi:ABC-type sugar transport system ATPase subunit